jgi:hypothetical protein
MANRFGIPAEVEQRIRARDARCVYCGKEFSRDSPRDRPTIEHLDEHPPFHWREGLTEDGLAICCASCNSSRGQKSLMSWFGTPYCTSRGIGLDGGSLAKPVLRYLRDNKACCSGDG